MTSGGGRRRRGVLVACALGLAGIAAAAASVSAAPGDSPRWSQVPNPSSPPPQMPSGALAPRERPAVPSAPELAGAYRFLSSPDFLNQDVADLRTLGRGLRVMRGSGALANSTNTAYDTALEHVIGEMADQGARDLLVAGDMVEGRWGRDDDRTGVFGPVATDRERREAWRRAAAVYYPAWRERFAAYGLRTYTALGDHELGDDPWRLRRPVARSARNRQAWVDFKRRHLGEIKAIYAKEMLRRGEGTNGGWRFDDRPPSGPARDTAYAVRLDRNVLLVTLDVFERRGGDVHLSLDPAQLRWLRGVLAKARRADVPWVMVQGHVPITPDVRYRNSSHLKYEEGTRSALWRTMVAGGVDVYLSGEVHDQTVHQRDGILQVSHGSLFYRGEASYVLGQATADRLVLENHQFRGEIGFSDRLWTTSRRGAPGHIAYPDPSAVTGTLEAQRTRSGGLRVVSAAGILTPE